MIPKGVSNPSSASFADMFQPNELKVEVLIFLGHDKSSFISIRTYTAKAPLAKAVLSMNQKIKDHRSLLIIKGISKLVPILRHYLQRRLMNLDIIICGERAMRG